MSAIDQRPVSRGNWDIDARDNKNIEEIAKSLHVAVESQLYNDDHRYNVYQWLAPMECERCGQTIQDECGIHIVEGISRWVKHLDHEAPRIVVSDENRTRLCTKCYQEFYMRNRDFFEGSECERLKNERKLALDLIPRDGGGSYHSSRTAIETGMDEYGLDRSDYGMW